MTKIEAEGEIALRNTSLLLENLADLQKIECLNWKEYPYRPRVEFRIGHAGDWILLKFYVTEKSIRAMETQINGKVHLDSCVEFFLSLDGVHYYNFEFNCIGTPHAAWGNSRHNRIFLSPEKVKTILVRSSLGSEPFETRTGQFTWDLVVVIPASCLVYDEGIDFSGLSGEVNFYKCGDALPEPHFLTWNPVGTPQPDYHVPEYFGKIDFE